MLTALVLSAIFVQNPSGHSAKPTVAVLASPPTGGVNTFYVTNRVPLDPNPFRKLPIGAIHPDGWLRRQLELEANGFTGHLGDISEFLVKKDNAWLSPTGAGVHGWEELPYWLKGFGDLGYILQDPRILREADFWIQRVLQSSRPDGWFGPESNRTGNKGKPDMWPNMVMLFALQSYYEYSKDRKVIDLMRAYFKWQLALPDDQFYLSYWEKERGGDNLASVYWLYNRTGDEFLLDLARKIHRRTDNWAGGVPDWHGVNFAQAFRELAEYALLDSAQASVSETENDYETMKQKYGQVPGGMYGADENARPGYTGPRQGTETCAMVEMMGSCEMLLAETGNPVWAERCEDVAFNSLPASMTADLKALHYLTAPNVVKLDAGDKSPELQDGGAMLSYNPSDYRCCQHNVSQGWPYLAENLWFGTDENGLAAPIYAPCTVTAKVDFDQSVTIKEDTKYPFENEVNFRFTMQTPSRFPLTLRLPSWCADPKLLLNGKELSLPVAKGSQGAKYAVVETEWNNGDVLRLVLPMHVEVKIWTENHDSVSVSRGPLTYALEIGESYKRIGGTDLWPAYEVDPTTPWNFGLVLDGFSVVRRPWPKDGQPFDLAGAPLELKTHAREIPGWTADKLGLVGLLQASPAHSDLDLQTVTLVPMGAARLRISAFPTVSTTGGTAWKGGP